ncbi:MAG: DUF4133 domain-containing protein [Prevotellaceae bacterium]|jgi:hypothetical protein|nr:DUF4133 domain-containing protein [Prevotellaceae bacterium]
MGKRVVHKGVGKTVELFGLRSRYLMWFCGGIFGVFMLFVALRMLNVPLGINAGLVAGGLVCLLRYVFLYNKKYGRYGQMKKNARSRSPRFLTSRKSFYQMLKVKENKSNV